MYSVQYIAVYVLYSVQLLLYMYSIQLKGQYMNTIFGMPVQNVNTCERYIGTPG